MEAHRWRRDWVRVEIRPKNIGLHDFDCLEPLRGANRPKGKVQESQFQRRIANHPMARIMETLMRNLGVVVIADQLRRFSGLVCVVVRVVAEALVRYRLRTMSNPIATAEHAVGEHVQGGHDDDK